MLPWFPPQLVGDVNDEPPMTGGEGSVITKGPAAGEVQELIDTVTLEYVPAVNPVITTVPVAPDVIVRV